MRLQCSKIFIMSLRLIGQVERRLPAFADFGHPGKNINFLELSTDNNNNLFYKFNIDSAVIRNWVWPPSVSIQININNFTQLYQTELVFQFSVVLAIIFFLQLILAVVIFVFQEKVSVQLYNFYMYVMNNNLNTIFFFLVTYSPGCLG